MAAQNLSGFFPASKSERPLLISSDVSPSQSSVKPTADKGLQDDPQKSRGPLSASSLESSSVIEDSDAGAPGARSADRASALDSFVGCSRAARWLRRLPISAFRISPSPLV